MKRCYTGPPRHVQGWTWENGGHRERPFLEIRERNLQGEADVTTQEPCRIIVQASQSKGEPLLA